MTIDELERRLADLEARESVLVHCEHRWLDRGMNFTWEAQYIEAGLEIDDSTWPREDQNGWRNDRAWLGVATVGPSGDAWEARMVSPNTDTTIAVRGEDKERALLALRKAINAGR